MNHSICPRAGAIFVPIWKEELYRNRPSSPRPSSIVPAPWAVFLPPQAGYKRGGKNGGEAQTSGRAKPHTGSRGVPRRTPCRRQGIVRYTSPTTAHENARPEKGPRKQGIVCGRGAIPERGAFRREAEAVSGGHCDEGAGRFRGRGNRRRTGCRIGTGFPAAGSAWRGGM